MKTAITALVSLWMVLSSPAAFGGQGNEPESAPAEKPSPKRIWPKVDRKAGKITFDATVVDSTYALEFLLCTEGGKEYESLLSTKIMPSSLHASLLMLGLQAGIPGHYVGPQYIPPRGAGLKIELEWKDKKGKVHLANAVEWLDVSGENKRAVKPDKWIFVGSDVMPDGQYIADSGGGIIAVANLPSAVIDVPFQSVRNLQDRQFGVDRKVIPPVGTNVKVIITPEKDAANAKYARANLDIDRFGRLMIDGKKISMEALGKWASDFSDKHREAMVVIRSAPLTPSCYAPRAKLEMKLGGIYYFESVSMDYGQQLLPRTADQLNAALKKWDERFRHPEDQLISPDAHARETLQLIRARREDFRKLDELLVEYEKRLKESIAAARSKKDEKTKGSEK